VEKDEEKGSAQASPFAKLEYEEWVAHSSPSIHQGILSQQSVRHIVFAMILTGLALLLVYAAFLLVAR